MTISIESSVATYTGNGVLTVFDVKDGANGIYFAAASELVVTIDGVLRTLTTHYTVSGAGTAAGQVTFLTAPANGTEVRIRRDTPRVQELDLSQGSTYDPASVETQLDRMARAIQDVGWIAENPDQVDVSIVIGTVTVGVPTSLPSVSVSEVTDGEFELDFDLPASDPLEIGTTTTLAPGSPASATITGTSPNRLLNLGIPRGETGSSGAGTGDLLGANNLTDVASRKSSFDNLTLRGGDVASAATVNLETATGRYVSITGTTAISAITLSDGHERVVRFAGVLTLTNGASLILPTGTDVPTASGDVAVFVGEAAGVVRCVDYMRADGTPLALASNQVVTSKIADLNVTTAKIAADAVTYAKMQNVSAAALLLGRGDGGGAGDTQEIALGTGLSMTGTTLNASTATAATQAEEEAAASTTVFTTPGRQQYHPGSCKAWVNFNSAGTVAASYNITSITDNAIGNWTVNIATDFSSASYTGTVTGGFAQTSGVIVYNLSSITAGTYQIRAFQIDAVCGDGLADPTTPNQIHAQFFGDQA